MRETIFWSTTPEKVEQRKIASAALSEVYEVEWQFFDKAKPVVTLISEQDYSSPAIYIFEINTDFALEQIRVVERTFDYNQKGTRTILLIGLLTEFEIPKGQTFKNWVPYLDGVVTPSAALADEWTLGMLTPVKCLHLPVTRSKPEQQFFVESFSAFLKTIRMAKVAMTAMNKVSYELLYLGVEDDAILIDSVADLLCQFWS